VRFPGATHLVILVNDYYKWLTEAAYRRLIAELAKLKVKINSDKTKLVDLTRKDTFSFLGFVYRRVKTRKGKWAVVFIPKIKARTTLLRKLKDIFARFVSQPVSRIIYLINPILRGWVNYFRIGHSSKCFGYVKGWVEKKIRRHLQRARKRHGFGWNRWSSAWLYNTLGLYNDYKIRYFYA
jgi:RNA-directed DNA polymerase